MEDGVAGGHAAIGLLLSVKVKTPFGAGRPDAIGMVAVNVTLVFTVDVDPEAGDIEMVPIEGFTVWTKIPLLPPKFASPLYVAVMVCAGGLTARPEVVHTPCRSDPFAATGTAPQVGIAAPVTLSAKATVPVKGTFPPGVGEIVAVNVTAPFTCDGLSDEETATLLPALFTVCVSEPGPTLKFVSFP